jgi:hypothetical protein
MLLLAAAAAVAVPGTAAATWPAGSAPDAAGRAAAMAMAAGNTPSAGTGSSSSSVVVSWPTSQNGTGGVPVDGYEVSASDATSGLSRTVGAGCDALVVGLTCTETGVPAGTWRYSVTPRRLSWAGAKSELSDPITVPLELLPTG